MEELGSTIKVVALGGESFQLGRLYDCRTQKVLPMKNLWDENSIRAHTKTSLSSNTDFKINASNNLSDRAKIFDVKGSVKLGILCGLISLSGNWNYLRTSRGSKKSSSISLLHKIITRTESLTHGIMKKVDNLEVGSGTHVIIEITYGARSVFDFQLEETDYKHPIAKSGLLGTGQSTNTREEETSHSAYELLKGAIEKITNMDISIGGEVRDTKEEKEKTSSMQCTFEGELYSGPIPKTYEDAQKLYHELPNSVMENQHKAVPLMVKMISLKEVNTKFEKIYKEVNDIWIQQISDIFEKFEEIQMRLNDIMGTSVFSHFPDLKKDIEKLQNNFEIGLGNFKSRLREALPEIRDGFIGEQDLKLLIEDWNSSPFSFANSDLLITNLEHYYGIIGGLIKTLLENSNEAKLNKCISKQDSTVAFVLLCQGKTNKFMSEQENYLNNKDIQENYSTIIEFKDVSDAFNMAKEFKNCALASSKTNLAFALCIEKHLLEMDFDLQYFENGKCSKTISLPQAVQNVEAKQISANYFDVSWIDNLNDDSIIQEYDISITKDSGFEPILCQKVKSKVIQIQFSKPEKSFYFGVSAVTKFGCSEKTTYFFEPIPSKTGFLSFFRMKKNDGNQGQFTINSLKNEKENIKSKNEQKKYAKIIEVSTENSEKNTKNSTEIQMYDEPDEPNNKTVQEKANQKQMSLNQEKSPPISYPKNKQLTNDDIWVIKMKPQGFTSNTWEDLQNLFFQKVFSHDQQARNLEFPPNAPFESYNDLLISTMERCDEFALQNFFEKLTDNQFAVPVLCCLNGQNTFLLWALRNIKKSWKLNKKTSVEKFISRHPMKTISFCRVGELNRYSKSVIINNIMSNCQGADDYHSFFLDKENDNGLSQNRGSIEACFFCPDARDGETFKDIHCIYNLRGDAHDFSKQVQFLLNVSSVLVIISEKKLINSERQKLSLDKDKNIIFVDLEKTLEQSEEKLQNISISAGKLNLKNFCKNLVSVLTEIIGENVLTIEQHSLQAKDLGFEIDEERESCKMGKQCAERFLNEIEKINQNERKEQIVPLQGKHWKYWAEMDKEELRRKAIQGKDLVSYVEEINTRKEKCRKDQRDLGVSSAMKIFLEEINKLPNENLKFFIDWCQLFLNWTSQEQIYQLKQKFQIAKDTHSMGCSKDIETNEKSELCKISEKLFQLSFGLENIFRELGQIYECNLITKKYNFLPKCMAKMMLLGYSLEIMDGDVSHVPTTWVREVLKNLEAELKPNSKVMVLSVLGIQSCGKSTLLNEMFGCKFPVSAGRCTKGVFVQLIPVETELRKKMKCDYFLVMDAEGLRSPNLSGEFCHDNEIATFVTFLSDLTLVTFQGDTLSIEMKEILEIIMHAYARMKEVEIKSFVHLTYLRVSGHDREDKNLGVEQKVISELNKIAMEIASLENRPDLVGGFSAVFQSLKDKYQSLTFEQTLPNLWIGNMRVPESRFGQLTGKLRDSICNALMNPGDESFKASELSMFSKMLENTWKAIKAENFVLNFKNTKQIDSYRKLEKEYYRLKDGVWQKFVCQSSLVEQTEDKWLSFNSDERAISDFMNTFDKSVNLNADLENFSLKLIHFIHSLEDPDYASKHNEGFMNDLNISIKNWTLVKKENIKEKIKLVYVKINMESTKDYKIGLKSEINRMAEELRKNKTELTYDDIIYEFDRWFEKELSKAEVKDKEIIKFDSFNKVQCDTISNLQEKLDILKVPHKSLADAKGILKEIKVSKEKRFYLFMKPNDHLKKSYFKQLFWGGPSDTEIIQITNKWRLSEKNILELLDRETTRMYDHINSPELVKQMIVKTIEEIYKFEHNGFVFTSEFIWHALVQVYGFTVKRIAGFFDDYIRKASHYYNLQEMKLSLCSDFVKDCKQVNQSLRMGEKFTDQVLMEAIIFHIQVSKGREISDHLKKSPELSTKSETSFRILEELLDVDTHNFNAFFDDYKNYAEKWIFEKALSSCKDGDYLQKWLKKEIAHCIERISDHLKSLSQETYSTLGAWYEALNCLLMNEKDDTNKIKIQVSTQDFLKLLSTTEHPDILAFTEETDRLINKPDFHNATYEGILDQSNNTLSDHKWMKVLNWLEFKPLDCLQDQLLGCTDQCPLCGAICDGGVTCKDEKNRTQAHSTEIHLPSGICGRYWVNSNRLCSSICSVEVLGSASFKVTQRNKDRFGIDHDEFIPYTQANETFKGIWKITPDASSEATYFWKFLFVKHQKEISEIKGLEEAENIPASWYNITREQALENLKYLKNQI